MSTEGYTKFFKEADTDGDGYLSLEELTAILRKNGYKTSDLEIQTMFNATDISGDNKISLDEYLFAMGKRPQTEHRNAATRVCFRTFDKNGDGKIDRAELYQVFREMGNVLPTEYIDRMIQLADKNKDGVIDYEEFMAQVFRL